MATTYTVACTFDGEAGSPSLIITDNLIGTDKVVGVLEGDWVSEGMSSDGTWVTNGSNLIISMRGGTIILSDWKNHETGVGIKATDGGRYTDGEFSWRVENVA